MVKKEGLFEVEKWLEREEKPLPKGKRKNKDYRDRKTELSVLDIPTLEILYKFTKRGLLKALGGPISSGKEAVIFHAIGAEEEELAIKMYKVSTSNFNAMLDYIIGDPRFENIKRDRRSIVSAWARKELKNLKRAFDAGVGVPKPIAVDKNVLIMEFIGRDGVAAPRLRDVPVDILKTDFELEELLLRIISYIQIMYEKGTMVHADLSEFNILMKGYVEREFGGIDVEIEPVIIDMGQSTLLQHPNADEFLLRDVRNIVTFFNKLGLDCSFNEIIRLIKR
uniref:non-specific serine/threonine protein kinase n=1 Tax=Candidatus Methanophaga sp. ANME-1 ERB7 TaxID=2759913 RepID=A0A7G9Z349_9EURY|nr:RIO-type serine/threonine-protein kinase Rio1 [Methanosarcinales archaeon ANME-1 ERB7]